MKLLKLTEKEYEQFDPIFEETGSADLEEMSPQVIDGKTGVKLKSADIDTYDAVYSEIPPENAVFGRVLLETIEEKGIKTNYPSTAFFIMSKKNYLYQVLNQKDIPCPKTVSIASEKAARNIDSYIELPLIARKFDSLKETEKRKIETWNEAESFVEGVEYPEEFILFHHLNEGERYRCLYAGGEIISLKDDSGGWKFNDEKLKYSSMGSELEEIVEKTAKAIGTPTAEMEIRDGKIQDVNPNPRLEKYTELSGKNAYEAAASALKGDEN